MVTHISQADPEVPIADTEPRKSDHREHGWETGQGYVRNTTLPFHFGIRSQTECQSTYHPIPNCSPSHHQIAQQKIVSFCCIENSQ
ncbi:hypothetical protein JTE90_027715 [Oedothorax gibbosus]|uniref:Uncharacterized protein n=1 Tax=Oedothorax gibbosus TaxID=931172 RepID=A0AAV6UVV3_9ARAC|nr:hypothetical protein JTE90_027715 [Oedothorax gibbosus]